MNAPATPRKTRFAGLPLIWVVPLAALVIAGSMVFHEFRNRGSTITIEFASGAGIEGGKTELEHKGVSIGTVQTVSLSKDLNSVTVGVRLSKAGEGVARAGSEFWVVHPEVSLSGIRGLETLVTGVRLQVLPGHGPPIKHFRGLDRPPPIDDPAAGRAFILLTDKLGGLTPRAPAYYRGVVVGTVETTRLASDATAAQIRIRIYTPYVDLVRTNSVFWNVSGVSFKLGFAGAAVRSTTLQALLAGGVSLATPEPEAGVLAPPARDGAEFRLYADPKKEWLKWTPKIPIAPLESAPQAPKPDSTGEPTLTGVANKPADQGR